MSGIMRPWWIAAGGLVAFTLICGALDLLWRANLSIYDASLPKAAAPSDIVIIAIDDPSISKLGRWPWRRDLHAQLLERLAGAHARAVALDLLLSEPDTENPVDDARLTQALLQGPPTVLPLVADLSSGAPIERRPIAEFAKAAAAIGHEDIELDRDGVARRVFLYEGLGAANRPHLMLALLERIQAAASFTTVTGERNPNAAPSPSAWVRDHRILIPYLGPPGHFKQYSYADVLDGRVAAEVFRDKIVLIGMTAEGGGDAYPTPTSGFSVAMPGIEINANVLAALRSDTEIRIMPLPVALLLDVLTIALACICFLRLAPRRSLFGIALLFGGSLAVCVLGLRFGHFWWPCAPALLSLALAYPIWSWLRLESAQRFIEAELKLLAAERLPLLGRVGEATPPPTLVDVIESRIELLRRTTARVRDLRQIFSDTVGALPDATLVIDLAGEVVLINSAAGRLLGTAAQGSAHSEAWRKFRAEQGRDLQFGSDEEVIEFRHGTPERDFLLRSVPFFASAASASRLGNLISIIDITELRAAQREREDVMRFLSHDLKSPASSLLGLAQLQRDSDKALQNAELADRLDGLAQKTLDLLDGFIALTQAESTDPMEFSELDMQDVLQDACDEVWGAAESRGTRIELQHPAHPVSLRGDRILLARAVVNLLSNAIKFSPPDSRIVLQCIEQDNLVLLSITDEGCGISNDMEPRLFRRFSRENRSGGPPGAGLGLAFVRVVAEKHGGSISYVRAAIGSKFVMSLPR